MGSSPENPYQSPTPTGAPEKKSWRVNPLVNTIFFVTNCAFLLLHLTNLDRAIYYRDDFFIYLFAGFAIGQAIVMLSCFSGPAYYLAPIIRTLAGMLERIGGRNGS